jgi:L-fucose isomerase-like protein
MAFGGRGMGQTCGVADPSQWMKTFGIDIDSRDTYELLETAKTVAQAQVDRMYETLDKKFVNKATRCAENDRSIRLYLALKSMKERGDFDFYTIQSFPGMGDYYTATCFAQSMMLEDGVPTSTLSDFNTAMSSILLTYLSRERVYYGDLQHIDKKNKEIKIIGDGAVPPSLANDGARFASHGIPTEGSAGGMSINLTCKPGKGVLARVSRVDGKFIMPIVRCTVKVPSPEEIEKRRHECGIPFWPHAFVTVEGDIEKLLENWNNEYACLGYGEDLYES